MNQKIFKKSFVIMKKRRMNRQLNSLVKWKIVHNLTNSSKCSTNCLQRGKSVSACGIRALTPSSTKTIFYRVCQTFSTSPIKSVTSSNPIPQELGSGIQEILKTKSEIVTKAQTMAVKFQEAILLKGGICQATVHLYHRGDLSSLSHLQLHSIVQTPTK